MNDAWRALGWLGAELPKEPLADGVRAHLDLPLTLRPIEDPRAVQRPVFDPALKQHARAYRATDPQFADPALAAQWAAARRRAMDLVLAAVADSAWVDHLVLRGSVLLRTWFGEAAREPGDLDFVVVPPEWRIEEDRTEAMLDGLARTVERSAAADRPAAVERSAAVAPGAVRFDAASAVSEEIWTYDRVPGRRLVLPWTAEGLPGGAIQLDFVFNEQLPASPEPVLVTSGSGGPGARLNAAGAELSLAWKLMWLVTDAYPQGKDLYDAVLLAERSGLRWQVLRDAFLGAEPHYAMQPITLATIAEVGQHVDWDDFAAEYPHIEGSPEEYSSRLTAALAPTFDDPAVRHLDGPALRSWWLTPWVERYRELLDRTSMPEVQQAMVAAGAPPWVGVVLTRELLGDPARYGLDEARAMVLADPAWSSWADFYQRSSGLVEQELRDWES